MSHASILPDSISSSMGAAFVSRQACLYPRYWLQNTRDEVSVFHLLIRELNWLIFTVSRSFPNIFPKSAPMRMQTFSRDIKKACFDAITSFIAVSRVFLSVPFPTSLILLSVNIFSFMFFRKGTIHLLYSSRRAGSLSKPFQYSQKYFLPFASAPSSSSL